MLVNQLFHIAIKSANVEATRRFYVDVMGMTLSKRPNFDFPGYWIQATVPGGFAIFHIYGGHAALEPDGTIADGTGAVDHLSISVNGFESSRERFKKFGLPYRENKVPDAGLLQLFVYDPSKLLLELTYLAEAEQMPDWQIPPELQYKPIERFFDPAAYTQFAG